MLTLLGILLVINLLCTAVLMIQHAVLMDQQMHCRVDLDAISLALLKMSKMDLSGIRIISLRDLFDDDCTDPEKIN